MPEAAFNELNERQAAAGDRLFTNPRNAAAGSVRQKDPVMTAARKLSIWVYQMGVAPRPVVEPIILPGEEGLVGEGLSSVESMRTEFSGGTALGKI